MVDVDPKVAQKVFKDYTRGHAVQDISQRHGLPTRDVNRVVKFESAVHARVQETLAKQAAKQAPKPNVRPVAKSSAKTQGNPKGGKK
jgi:hypothetical protein